MPAAAGRAHSEPPGKNVLATSASDMLRTTSPTATSDPYDDDPVLKALVEGNTLKRSPQKKRNPSAKWDGRVGGMSIQEYRDRKWSTDACYAKVERRGPAYSIRKPLPAYFGKRFTNFSVGDVVKSLDATLPRPPSYTMGIQYFQPPQEKSQGPAEYKVNSTMDPSRHPTIPKHTGPRFGSEVLNVADPTGPAPGDYDPSAIQHSSTLKTIPKFTIQGRESWKPPTAAPGPGVGEFDISNVMRTGKLTTTKWTIQGKTEPLDPPLGSKQYEAPGPATYNGPGAGAKTNPMKTQNPIWKFGSEARGLRN